MDLYSNQTYIGTEVPRVVVPVNQSLCAATPPDNHTHLEAQITTCDVLPLAADAATIAFPNTLRCRNLPPPSCDQVHCVVVSNNDSFTFQLLPCHNPPAVRLSNRDVHGTSRFNQTFTDTTLLVRASIGDTPAYLNVSIYQHPTRLTLGVAVSYQITVGIFKGLIYFSKDFVKCNTSQA